MSTLLAPSIPEAHAGAVLTINLEAIAANYRLLADRLDDVAARHRRLVVRAGAGAAAGGTHR